MITEPYHQILFSLLLDLENGRGSEHGRTGIPVVARHGVRCAYTIGRQGRTRILVPMLRSKRVALKPILAELQWFLRGDTNNKTLQSQGVKIWNEWSTSEKCAKFNREEGDLGPIYGHQWRRFGADYPGGVGVDQISRIVRDLSADPTSRRLLVSAWNPAQIDDVELPPCHTLFQLCTKKVDNDYVVDLILYQRSGDWLLGVPFNIVSYSVLLALICNSATGANFIPGALIHVVGDAHLYGNHLEAAQSQRSYVNASANTNSRIYDGVWLDIDRAATTENFDPIMVKVDDSYDPPSIRAPVAV